jgi:hypothetical protein
MSKTNKKLLVIAVILVAAFSLLSWQAGIKNKKASLEKQNIIITETPAKKISVGLYVDSLSTSTLNLEIAAGATVLQILEEANRQNKLLNLQTKDYKEMGVLVEGIGGKINGQDKKYWQYYVNGQQPMIGADKYILNDNDKIEWFFKESEF